MYTNQYRVNGALVFYDDTELDGLQEIWIDAFGKNVIKDIDDCRASGCVDAWSTNGSGTHDFYFEVEEAGEVVLEVTGDTSSKVCRREDEVLYKVVGEPMSFGCSWRVSDATDLAALVGLTPDSTQTLLCTHGIYFRKDDGDTALYFVTEDGSTETATDTGITMVADTYVDTSFYWDGVDTVRAYVNDDLVATHTTNLPGATDALVLKLVVVNGEAATNYIGVQNIRCIKVGA